MTDSVAGAPVPILTDERAVRAFLAEVGDTDGGSAELTFLTGGVSSVVVRVVTPSGCRVLKQALPRLRVRADWFSRPARSGVEVACARLLEQIAPGSIPAVLAEYPDVHAFAMECAPPGSAPWKDELLNGTADGAIADQVGGLLGRVQRGTAGDAGVRAAFADRSFFRELRLDPYFAPLAEQYPQLRPDLDELVKELDGPGACLVHGDYSPKNMLVTPERGVLLLDHEVAHWGHPAFDLAFVISHLVLKRLHMPGASSDLTRAIDTLVAGYTSEAPWGSPPASTGGVLLALVLSRVDGTSPVEYLDEDERRAVRAMILSAPPLASLSLDEALALTRPEIPHG